MVEREKTTDYNCSRTSLVKKWKGKQYRLAHFLVAMLVLVVGGLLVASYAYSQYGQYSQSNVTTQLIGFGMLYQSNTQILNKGMPAIPKIDEIVPVAEKCPGIDVDTVPGTIQPDGMVIAPLPLCVNTNTLAGDWVAVIVTGGYHPKDGYITVTQEKTGKGGVIKLHWELMNPEASCCVPKVWNASLVVCEPFCLDSNQFPILIGMDGCQLVPVGDLGKIADKEVTLVFNTLWSGCENKNQEFWIIPVQNN